MSRDIIMGIDVGSTTVKTVIAERQKGKDVPAVLGTGVAPSHGLRRGSVVNENDVAIAIRNSVSRAQESANTKIRHAFVSIDGIGVDSIKSKGSILVSRADSEISKNDLARAEKQSETQLSRNFSSYIINREILHSFPVSYKVDDELVIGNPVGIKGEKLEIETIFVSSPTQHIKNLLRSFEIAGITVEGTIAAPWAMSHTLVEQKEKEVGCLLINIGGDSSSLISFEDGVPLSVNTLPIGSNHITHDIARGFQVLIDEAEKLKMSYNSDPAIKRKLNSVVEPRLSDIFELADKHLEKIKRSGLLPGGVILTGGGSNLDGVEENSRISLKLPTQIGRPKFIEGIQVPISDPMWSTALGLCIVGLDTNGELMAIPGSALSKAKGAFRHLIKIFSP